jgi:hypothetical protein
MELDRIRQERTCSHIIKVQSNYITVTKNKSPSLLPVCCQTSPSIFKDVLARTLERFHRHDDHYEITKNPA